MFTETKKFIYSIDTESTIFAGSRCAIIYIFGTLTALPAVCTGTRVLIEAIHTSCSILALVIKTVVCVHATVRATPPREALTLK